MKKKTLIVFTVEAGLAHLTRSLAVGEALQNRGHRVFIAIHPSKHHFIRRWKLRAIPAEVSLDDNEIRLSMDRGINRWKDPRFVTRLARSDRAILDKIKPDAVLVDFRSSAVAASLSLGLPTFFLTGSGGLPYGCYLPNAGYPTLLQPIVSRLAQQIIWRIKLPFFQATVAALRALGTTLSLEETIRRMTYIVPETPEYLPPQNDRLTIHHVGPIIWKGFGTTPAPWQKNISKNGKTVYLTFGGTGFDSTKMVTLAQELVWSGFRVIVSCGTIADPRDFPTHPFLYVARFLPGDEICRRVDAVVCHGGYGTLMQAVMGSAPSVAVPFNPDQLLHGLRCAELHLTQLVFHWNASMIVGGWDGMLRAGRATSTREILEAVQSVIQRSDDYHSSMKQFQKRLEPYRDGSEVAASLLET